MDDGTVGSDLPRNRAAEMLYLLQCWVLAVTELMLGKLRPMKWSCSLRNCSSLSAPVTSVTLPLSMF